MSVTAKCLIEAQYAPASIGILYTVPGSTRTIVDKFTVVNSSVSSQSLSIYIVPAGYGPGADGSNILMAALAFTAGVTADYQNMQNQILNAGDQIAIFASAGSSLSVRMSGRECT